MFGMCISAGVATAQRQEQRPETPVEKWSGKTAMLIGAHADDDMLSHGTLAMLQAHGNQVYVVTLTTGNVGTQDPNLSRAQLAQIRRQEELAALAELGIPGEHYINLGYPTGSSNLRIARRSWKIWCAGSGSCDPMCSWPGTRARTTNDGISQTTALPPTWLRTQPERPCGACFSKVRLPRKASRST